MVLNLLMVWHLCVCPSPIPQVVKPIVISQRRLIYLMHSIIEPTQTLRFVLCVLMQGAVVHQLLMA